jgi:outer membrane receptor protein involved in Fe transport
VTVLYLQEEWRPNDRWTLVAGGNYADTKPGGKKAQPRLAAIFHPNDRVAVKALYGRGFRPPSVFEARYEDPISNLPNPDLESEEITSRELSVMWQDESNHSADGLVVYRREYDAGGTWGCRERSCNVPVVM